MGDDEEGDRMIQPLGPQAIQQRMAEIEAKLESVFGAPATPSFESVTNFSGGLSGSITAKGTTPDGGFQPLKLGGGIGVEATSGKADRFRSLIERAAQANNVDSKLLTALVEAESDFDPNCRSKAGAMGLTQLMPETARSMGIGNPFDPGQNLMGGARYLRQMLDRFGSIEPALAAYNAGPGAVLKYGGVPNYPETKAYVAKIMARYQRGNP